MELKLTKTQLVGLQMLKGQRAQAEQSMVQFLRMCVEEAGENAKLNWMWDEQKQALVYEEPLTGT